MKTVDIKGKSYVMVNERLKAFRAEHKGYGLLTEIVELTCILEKILRDFYMDIAHIVYKTNQVEYIERLIEKSTNNDFMHFDKANNR